MNVSSRQVRCFTALFLLIDMALTRGFSLWFCVRRAGEGIWLNNAIPALTFEVQMIDTVQDYHVPYRAENSHGFCYSLPKNTCSADLVHCVQSPFTIVPLTSMAIWHGGGFKSKLLSSTVFPLHLKSVKWHSLRSRFLSPHTMYKLITLSSGLGLNSLLLSRLTLCQLVSSPQMSNWNEWVKFGISRLCKICAMTEKSDFYFLNTWFIIL